MYVMTVKAYSELRPENSGLNSVSGKQLGRANTLSHKRHLTGCILELLQAFKHLEGEAECSQDARLDLSKLH